MILSFVRYLCNSEERSEREQERKQWYGGSRFVEIYEKPVVFIKSFVATGFPASRENSRASETIL